VCEQSAKMMYHGEWRRGERVKGWGEIQGRGC